MNFAVVVELACLVAYVTVLVGGRMSREDGWKVLSPLLGLCAVGQAVAMALVVRSPALLLLDNYFEKERFFRELPVMGY